MAGALFGDQSAFFDNQDTRGLQVEAVAASPWYLRQAIIGKSLPITQRRGSSEIGSGLADAVAVALKWLGLLVLLAAALWWVARGRAIRRGRIDLAEAAVSIDFVFTVVILQIVVSRVLSPQYMIWVIGLYQTPASMAIRNLALVVAGVDAAIAMFGLLRERSVWPIHDAGSEVDENRIAVGRSSIVAAREAGAPTVSAPLARRFLVHALTRHTRLQRGGAAADAARDAGGVSRRSGWKRRVRAARGHPR